MYKFSKEEERELLTKWEPKVFSILKGTSVRGMEIDDVAQELRLVILRAASQYDASRGASFHTYLHTALVNTVRTLITKAQRHPEEELFDETFYNSFPDRHFVADTLKPILEEVELDPDEKKVLDLLLSGYNLSEIERLGVILTSAQKVRRSLRRKFNFLKTPNV